MIRCRVCPPSRWMMMRRRIPICRLSPGLSVLARVIMDTTVSYLTWYFPTFAVAIHASTNILYLAAMHTLFVKYMDLMLIIVNRGYPIALWLILWNNSHRHQHCRCTLEYLHWMNFEVLACGPVSVFIRSGWLFKRGFMPGKTSSNVRLADTKAAIVYLQQHTCCR